MIAPYESSPEKFCFGQNFSWQFASNDAVDVLKYVVVLGIVIIALCIIPPSVLVYRLIHDIMTVRLIKCDGFSIVKDTVSCLSKGEVIRRNSTVNVIYFVQYGRFVPSGTTYDLTSVGDTFYLAVLHTKKKEPCMVFHTDMYEFSDID